MFLMKHLTRPCVSYNNINTTIMVYDVKTPAIPLENKKIRSPWSPLEGVLGRTTAGGFRPPLIIKHLPILFCENQNLSNVFGCRDPMSKGLGHWDGAYIYFQTKNSDSNFSFFFIDHNFYFDSETDAEMAAIQYTIHVRQGWRPMTLDDIKKTTGIMRPFENHPPSENNNIGYLGCWGALSPSSVTEEGCEGLLPSPP